MSTVADKRSKGFVSRLGRYVLVAGLFSALIYFYTTMILYFN